MALASAFTSALADDLRIGFNAEVTSADPDVHQLQNRNVWMHVYEPLVKQDAQLRSVPGLARGWRSTDPLTWVFSLRPNVLFHDGSTFGAEDAKASIERARTLQGTRTLKSYLRDIASVNVIDPLTVQIKTKVPSPAMPDDLSLIPMLPKSVVAGATEESFAQGKSAIGTGPYRFVEWSRGQKVILARNDKYWGAKEPWEHVTFEFILKEPSRASALLSGTVDVINGATADVVDALHRNDKLGHVDTVSYMLNYLYFNLRPTAGSATDAQGKPLPSNPLKDARVRNAISLAINRDLISKRVMKGDSVPANQLVPAGFFGYDPSIKQNAVDPARAKALLAEAGYPQGFNLTLHCSNDRYLNDARVCEAIGQMLTQIGIRADVQTLPFAVLQPRAIAPSKGSPELSVAMMGFGAAFGDSLQPLIALGQTYDAKEGAGANNYGRFSDPQLDALIERAGETMSPAEREELQRKAGRVLFDEVGLVPLQHLKASWAFRKGLTVVPRSDGFIYAMDVRETSTK